MPLGALAFQGATVPPMRLAFASEGEMRRWVDSLAHILAAFEQEASIVFICHASPTVMTCKPAALRREACTQHRRVRARAELW